jgi:hypothetical protein
MAKRPFDKLLDWIEDNGYTVKFSRSDSVDYDEKVITLIRNNKNLIFSILHECGHIIYNNNKNKVDCRILDKGQFNRKFSRTNLYKYKKLQDEMLAWEEGYKLAKQLRVRINKHDYDAYAAKNFQTYVKYFA